MSNLRAKHENFWEDKNLNLTFSSNSEIFNAAIYKFEIRVSAD